MKKTISIMMALSVAGTMAAPAMAVNDEPMVIAPAPNAQSQQAQMKIVVKGKTMPVQTISVNGCTMAPVRAICEALDFKVTWNADRSININNGEMQSDLRIGDNSYVVYTAVEGMAGMSAPFSLGSAPIIKNNTAYVPIDLFVPLFGNDPATVKTSGDTITINPDAKTEDGDSSQIPNLMTAHDSLAELAKAVGFDIKAPTVPAGYEADAYIDISGELAEVFYAKGDDTLVYRVSRGEGDNSGDYNTYSNKKTVDVNGVSVELRGNDKVNVATWSNGGFAYSVSAKQGISETEVAAVVSSAL
ncbi:stalk domain-containing protein [Agathobaculum sp.]|uniref:stalk domain-containing protein n=1 Tax=Agathobaculum sp. TaxID=2048138 RepID=UPI003A835058